MKLYRDLNGDLYRVDRETGEKTLIQKAEAEQGQDSGPLENAEETED